MSECSPLIDKLVKKERLDERRLVLEEVRKRPEAIHVFPDCAKRPTTAGCLRCRIDAMLEETKGEGDENPK